MPRKARVNPDPCPSCGVCPWLCRPGQRCCSKECSFLLKSRQTHPDLQEDYFQQIDTADKAYWLGFLYADGCVAEQAGGHTLKLALAVKDEDWIDRFVLTVGADPSRTRTVYKANSQQREVNICNRLFVGHLLQQGCVPRKSRSLTHPSLLDHTLERAFLLGYFDGDGTISQGWPVLTCGSSGFLAELRQIHGIKNLIRVRRSSYYELSIGTGLYRELLHSYPNSMPRKRFLGKKDPHAGAGHPISTSSHHRIS